jgi:hypothetical protein
MPNKILSAIIFILSPCSISAQQVVFECSLQNADQGWMITASNSGPGPRTCTASCEAQSDGGRVAFGNELFCGNANASTTPLTNPKITASDCN